MTATQLSLFAPSKRTCPVRSTPFADGDGSVRTHECGRYEVNIWPCADCDDHPGEPDHPAVAAAGPPIRREPSDPELWEAVLHPDGYRRTEALLDRRHGDDAAAKLAGLRAFRAPNRYQTTDPRSEHWAGWMVVLESKLEGRCA